MAQNAQKFANNAVNSVWFMKPIEKLPIAFCSRILCYFYAQWVLWHKKGWRFSQFVRSTEILMKPPAAHRLPLQKIDVHLNKKLIEIARERSSMKHETSAGSVSSAATRNWERSQLTRWVSERVSEKAAKRLVAFLFHLGPPPLRLLRAW